MRSGSSRSVGRYSTAMYLFILAAGLTPAPLRPRSRLWHECCSSRGPIIARRAADHLELQRFASRNGDDSARV